MPPLIKSPGWGALDQSRPDAPSERGCVSAGDVVSPTGGAPSPVTGETAPGPSTGTTALGLETPALSPSPGYPRRTTAAGQAWTPGLPPRRGASGVLGHGRNSTGPAVAGEPSVAPGLGTSQWAASRVAGTFSSRAPGPTHSSPLGAMDSLPASPGWLPPNSTTEPLFRPAPTQGPMDHVEWHASLPTRDTPPVYLWTPRGHKTQTLDPLAPQTCPRPPRLHL